MDVIFEKPSEKPKRKSISCSFTSRDNSIISDETIEITTNYLRTHNENIGASYCFSPPVGPIVIIDENLQAEEDSPLYYQMNSCHFLNRNDNDTCELCEKFPIDRSDRYDLFSSVATVNRSELMLNLSECRDIEKQTRAQVNSHHWFQHRIKRFTASNFGEIIHRQHIPNDKFLGKILSIKTRDLSNVPSIKHGRINESEAREKYKLACPNIKVFPVGLVINPAATYLGASPDGHLIDESEIGEENGVLEIKCPTWNSFHEGTEQVKSYYLLNEESGYFTLKSTSNYYSQVQGQMLISGVTWCDFVVYIKKSNELQIERIYFNKNYCTEMLQKLSNVYINFAVKYLELVENKENVL